jgi:HK97 family phage prohead protease
MTDLELKLTQSQNPNARKLRQYWTTGVGGTTKIRWKTPGDFTRCVKHLNDYVTNDQAKRMCANYHKTMTGMWPGDARNKSIENDDEQTLSDETLLYVQTLRKLSTAEIIDIFGNDASEPEDKGMEMDIEHKNLGVTGGITETAEEGVIEALVSVTGIKDNVNDIIMPGAYEKTLEKRKPKGVWSHDWNNPVSKVDDIKELLPGDPKLPTKLANGEEWPKEAGALYVKVRFNLETQAGRDAYSNVKFYADETEWSIGYNVPKGAATLDKKSGVRNIKTLELFEFSPVLFGAASNARTLISSVKSMFDNDADFMAEVKSVLESGEPAEVPVTDVVEAPVEPSEPVTEPEPTVPTPEVTEVAETEPTQVVGETEVVSTEEVIKDYVAKANDDDVLVAGSATVATPAQAAEINEAINGVKGYIPQEDVPDRVQQVDSAIEVVEAIQETATTTPPNGVLIEKLKTLQQEVGSLLSELNIDVAQNDPEPVEAPKTVVVEESKSMREAVRKIVDGDFDSGIADELDNGVRALEQSIKALDMKAIATNATDVLDVITDSMQSGVANDQDIADLKALIAAIGEALQNTQKPNGSTTPIAQPQQVSPPASSMKTIPLEEWKKLISEDD